jgi:hypothetical protein
MKIKLDRVISVATLLALVAAIVLFLKKPAPQAQSQPAAAMAASAEPVKPVTQNQTAEPPAPIAAQTPAAQQQPSVPGSTISQLLPNSPALASQKTNSNSNSDAISAAVTQMLGAAGGGGGAALSPDSEVGSGSPNIKDQKVDYDGDMVHGKFLTEIAGKDVWVTISGHMGQKDGYATFEPTEFKVGDMEVPVALVNPALQRKLAEERDRLKLADPAGAK